MPDTDFTLDLPDIESDELSIVPAHQALAEAALYAAIPPDVMNRIDDDEASLAMVVSVPSQDWIEPTVEALSTLREWNHTFVANAGGKKRPNGDICARMLADGRSVVGVATFPERQLPAALVTAADIRISIGSPDNSAIANVIANVTGERVMTMPARVATGLDFYDIVSAIRAGSTAEDCVRRLESATASLTVVDRQVADVPPLEQMVGFGSAGEWGLRLISDLQEWRSGV